MIPIIVLSFNSFALEDVDHEALWLVYVAAVALCCHQRGGSSTVGPWSSTGWPGVYRWRGTRQTSLLSSSPHMPMFVTAPVLVSPATRCGVRDARIRGLACAYLSRCRVCVSSTHRCLCVSCSHKNSGANSLPNRDSADLETEAGSHRETVRKPVEIPQLQILDEVTWHARCCATTVFMVLTEQKACGDSTVADLGHARCWFNDRSMVQTVQLPIAFPQLQILDKVT